MIFDILTFCGQVHVANWKEDGGKGIRVEKETHLPAYQPTISSCIIFLKIDHFAMRSPISRTVSQSLRTCSSSSSLSRSSRAPSLIFTPPQLPVQQRRTFFDLRSLANSASSSSTTSSSGKKLDRYPAPEGFSWPPSDPDIPSSCNTYHDYQTLPYTPCQLYEIVSDVDSYDEFLPFCTSARVLEDLDSHDDVKRKHAELGVGFKGFQEKYISLVELKDGQWVRAKALPHHLFKHLSTTWTFMPTKDDQTQIIFELNYQFSSPLYATLASGVFQELAGKMMSAFKQRAEEVYRREHI
ncbi:unnamed protein product [Sympodiomycopsis kandeliae]